MKSTDVTNQVEFGSVDDEYTYITKCICGYKFYAWDFLISIYEDTENACPACGRKFYFSNSVRIYMVEEDENVS